MSFRYVSLYVVLTALLGALVLSMPSFLTKWHGGHSFLRPGLVILIASLIASGARSETVGEPTGIWLTQAGDARVRVSKCGGSLCGVIVALKDPINAATGKPEIDDKNPDPALAKRPMIGLSLFSGMRPAG